MMEFYRFDPIYQQRVWGGRRLEDVLQRSLPAGVPIGESWEIVDREEACSVVCGGQQAGTSLRQLIQQDARSIMGPGWPSGRAFPILVKWLDCRERLSLQVHPPVAVAADLGGEPKTENWFIAAAGPEAAVFAGVKRGVTRDAFQAAVQSGCLEPLLHRIPVSPGDSLFVPSGRLHAIDAGNLILEIQQNSDTTYRVYDWGRVGLDGQPRQLHVKQSLACIDFNDFEPAILPAAAGDRILVDSPVFRLRQCSLAGGQRLAFEGREQARIVSVAQGALIPSAGPALEAGANVLVPWASAVEFHAEGDTLILVTDGFAGDQALTGTTGSA